MPSNPRPIRAKADTKRASRRADLIDVAGQVLLQKGFAGSTTLDIARAAGISKRDLYAEFPSKDALLRALIQSRVEVMAQSITLAAPTSAAAVAATLKSFAPAFLRTLLGPGPCALYRLAIADAQTGGESDAPSIGMVLLASGIAETTARLDDFMAQAEAAGHITLTDRAVAVRAFFAVLIGNLQMRQLLNPAARATPAEIERNVQTALAVFESFRVPNADQRRPTKKGRTMRSSPF